MDGSIPHPHPPALLDVVEPGLGEDAHGRQNHGAQVDQGAPTGLLKLGQPLPVARREAAEAEVRTEAVFRDVSRLGEVAELLGLLVWCVVGWVRVSGGGMAMAGSCIMHNVSDAYPLPP